MNESDILPSKTVDLTNCDREPIHIPNSIQPHGVLLVLSESEFEIVQVSCNTLHYLGIEPKDLLNRPLTSLLNDDQITNLRQCLAEDFEQVNPLAITIKRQQRRVSFRGIVHRSEGAIILELEATQEERKVSFFDFYQQVKSPVTKIQGTSTLSELCQIIVKEIRKLTQFDRVMVYRFDEEGAGTVIAEEIRQGLDPYLDLRYPPSDIPKQAKQLYILNLLRLIPDATYQPVGLIPTLNPITNEPLDMSLCGLRSVSPMHVEYMHNMGVAASMSISLVQNKKLWGLIACHHTSPKIVPYELRAICEFLAQIMSFELAAKEENEDLDYKMNLKSLQTSFVESLSLAEGLFNGLTQNPSHLLELVGARGVAIRSEDEQILIGETPTSEEIDDLLVWLKTQMYKEVIYQTNSLIEVYPPAQKFKSVASGLLALSIFRVQETYILWFRPEIIQTVNWGGNPNKPVEVHSNGDLRLSPRKSFALWQETVQNQSLRWKPCEIEAALELRSAIVGIVLRKADELTKVNQELEQSNKELDDFAYIASHDLKEPLRGIHNYASFLIEDYANLLDEEGVSKLQTLMRLTQRMENLIDSLLHFSRLGRAELTIDPINLDELVREVLDVLKMSKRVEGVEFRIASLLPTIEGDRAQVSELFTNLIGNAIKYNDKVEKWVEIGCLNSTPSLAQLKGWELSLGSESASVFYIRDNGIGIRQKHLESIFHIFKRLHAPGSYGGGTGAGLTIAKKIVERHGGKIWVESVYGEGSTFYFTLGS
jgi:two-component system, chemotaxis family, sensor kinase Cph1